MKHVAPSKARIAILGDYLIAVSKSIVVDQSAPGPAKKAARNRMDLLLIVNDVLHTDKFHRRNTIKQGIFSDECESFVVDLIEQGAVCITERASQLELKLRAIINYYNFIYFSLKLIYTLSKIIFHIIRYNYCYNTIQYSSTTITNQIAHIYLYLI